MVRWFSADYHFGHRNIIQYCNRPFRDENHMDREMIRKHNSRVQHDDTVYILGDVTLGIRAWYYLQQLNGILHIIPGGHDKRWIAYNECDPAKVIIEPPLLILGKKNPLTLCHYPLRSWERSHYGAHHLHGHCHGTIGVTGPSGDIQLPPGEVVGKRLDVGVDNWDFYPITLEKALEVLDEN